MSPYLETEYHKFDCIFEAEEQSVRIAVERDGRLALTSGSTDYPIAITSRSIQEYEYYGCIPTNAIKVITQRNLQVTEVGAGLSEFIVSLAEHSQTMPMIIDPLPYNAVDRLLSQAYPHTPIHTKKAITILQRRIWTITASDTIRLINMSLDSAYETLKDTLAELADIVIDFYGPSLYADRFRTKRLEENWLLKTPNYWCRWKPGGLLPNAQNDFSF